MVDHDALFAKAERLRVHGNEPEDFQRAIELYQQYLGTGGPNRRAAQHMTGVCYQRLHEYEEALEWYLAVLEGATAYERGNIERDAAEAYAALGEYDHAETGLATSLGLLPYDQYPEEHAASLGFLARLQLRRGQLDTALETFADADQRLRAGRNRQTELYNKLAFARALSLAGRRPEARKVALECIKLSTAKDPATGLRYGSHQHNLRALALLDEHGTEETLAAELGLTETEEMTALRQALVHRATEIDDGSEEFTSALGRYREIGEAIAEAKSDEDDARMRAKIALILLAASVWRDLATLEATFADGWHEETGDAATYAHNLGNDALVRAIERLPHPQPI